MRTVLSYYFNRIMNYFRKKKIIVVFSSSNFIVIDKPCDLKINSNNRAETTVQTLLKEQFPSVVNDKLFHQFYFPHRLDYSTSGLMCIPSNKEACRIISDTFQKRSNKKYYVAIVRGVLSKEIIEINMPIGEDVRESIIQKMCTSDSKYCVRSRTARTKLIVLDEGLFDNYPACKILIRPITGRRHQIRVHCCFLGHTIVGDFTYTNRKDIKPSRMYLHSLRLVSSNSLESIDVETLDPFKHVKEWNIIKPINSINKITFDKLEGSQRRS